MLHITHSLKQTDINYHNIKIHLQPVPWKCSLNIRGPNLVLWKAKDYGLSSLKKVKTQILNEELNVRVWGHPMISFSLPRLSLSVTGATIHLQYCCMMSDFRVQFEIHIFTLEASTHTKRTMHVLPGKTTKYPTRVQVFHHCHQLLIQYLKTHTALGNFGFIWILKSINACLSRHWQSTGL